MLTWLRKLWSKENRRKVCGVGFLRDRYNSRFTEPCAWHDLYYELKGDADKRGEPFQFTRLEVDQDMLRRMLEIVDQQKSWPSRYWLLGKAYLWYGLVRLFGGIVW